MVLHLVPVLRESFFFPIKRSLLKALTFSTTVKNQLFSARIFLQFNKNTKYFAKNYKMMEVQKDVTVSLGGNAVDPKNPHGLGDPNDKSLRKVEVEVLIPKIMRDRAKADQCLKEVKSFESCCKDNSIMMVINCRKQNDALKSCLQQWYTNETFKAECKEIYLKERSEYRATGIPKKHRVQKL